MFKTPPDYKFVENPTAEITYKIQPFDIIEFRIYTNDGYKLIDLISTNATSTSALLLSTEYYVDKDGFVKLPVLGNVSIKGLTRVQAETFLEEKYSSYYNRPFVKLKVINRRVYVFNGSGGLGSVVQLVNENNTLIETLARAGGISNIGKAKRIKIIRGDLKNPEIQLINLATVEGMKKANLTVQANDIIYVEPTRRLSQEILNQVTPVLSLLSSVLLVYGLLIKNR